MGRFCYFYMMNDAVAEIRETAPRHVSYWQQLQLDDYIGGPFADRSGGLICFSAESLNAARQIVTGDPFLKSGLLESWWLKEWLPE